MSAMQAAGAAMFATPSGCTSKGSLQALREELQALRGGRVAVPPLPGFRDLRGAIHSHSYISGDSDGRPEEFLAGACEAKLDYLVVTDHYDPRIVTEGLHGPYGDLLVIRGCRVPARLYAKARYHPTLREHSWVWV